MADKAKMELIEPKELKEPKEPKKPFTGRLKQPSKEGVEY
jgi:hypothetical protein